MKLNEPYEQSQSGNGWAYKVSVIANETSISLLELEVQRIRKNFELIK